jgi:hypothetical protein
MFQEQSADLEALLPGLPFAHITILCSDSALYELCQFAPSSDCSTMVLHAIYLGEN